MSFSILRVKQGLLFNQVICEASLIEQKLTLLNVFFFFLNRSVQMQNIIMVNNSAKPFAITFAHDSTVDKNNMNTF